DLLLHTNLPLLHQLCNKAGTTSMHSQLRKEGFMVNHKKTARLYYSVLQMQLRRKKRMKKIRLKDKLTFPPPHFIVQLLA
ncbi:MAG: hypothetical protein OYH77_05140, partial [Pseudomonadota bacterium]|nr:hypothetical protein [Pseudomonadota bacterium]